MAHLSIIGTGSMGQAIAAVAVRGGHTVQLLGQADSATPVTGEIVVLAVPYPAVSSVLAERGESLAGKVVVDITNPLDFETFDSLTVAADGSATAEIAAALPQSRVLKAFNTTFAGTLAAATVGPLTTTVLIAGDDVDAKRDLAGVITSGGLKAIDAGALSRARELEAIGFLQLTLAVGEKVAWTGGFGVVAA
jgi:NADPH-dependent F420 reductase